MDRLATHVRAYVCSCALMNLASPAGCISLPNTIRLFLLNLRFLPYTWISHGLRFGLRCKNTLVLYFATFTALLFCASR